MDRQIFDVYSIEELIDVLAGDTENNGYIKNPNSVALAPIQKSLDFLFSTGQITEDQKHSFRIFSLNISDLGEISMADAIDSINPAMEELSRDPNFKNFIILLQYPIPTDSDIKVVETVIRQANEYDFQMYPPEEEDIGDFESLLFIYSNTFPGKMIADFSLDNMNELIKEENNVMENGMVYYVSYIVNGLEGMGNKFNALVVTIADLITTPEMIEDLKAMIVDEVESKELPGVTTDNIFLISFSYMGPVKKQPEIRNDTFHVALITYKINGGEEMELTSTTDVDILDPKYAEYNLAESLVREQDFVNDDDEIEIINIESLGEGMPPQE